MRLSSCCLPRPLRPQHRIFNALVFARQSSSRAPDFAAIDATWQPRWKQHELWNAHAGGKGKYYVLPMFPYPSGSLHIGHLRNYTISDVLARFRRMSGYNVLHPIGWDAFGLPAENAAIERGIDPAKWTADNIAKMKQQIQAMGGCWDWDKELMTCDPAFYKDTQRLFLSLYKRGLAYQDEATVNYDPVDKTVLANEQVDSNGFSWRSGARVEQIRLRQWFVKITDFAPQLLNDLKHLEQGDTWPRRVIAMQENWLGKSDGVSLQFGVRQLADSAQPDVTKSVNVFTTRPDTLFGVQYLALSLDHPIVQHMAAEDSKLQLFIDSAGDAPPDSKAGFRLTSLEATNPAIYIANDAFDIANVPVYVAPYVKSDYGSGAVMGVPAHDLRDYAFWKLNSPDGEFARSVISPSSGTRTSAKQDDPPSEAFVEPGILGGNCYQYSGQSSSDASLHIVEDLIAAGPQLAQRITNWRIRDWLISRQRYWGTPIPIIHCKSCGVVPVPDEDLPVQLPKLPDHDWKDLRGNPLASDDAWCSTTCPKCSGPARRETDTMDTFVDSSWYYIRFAQAASDFPGKKPFMPVDLYIGGVEHAILHLLYSRFVAKFLKQTEPSMVQAGEPFSKLLTQGMVHGRTYSDPDTSRALKPSELDMADPQAPSIRATGQSPTVTFEKMSKSKHNGVDPIACTQKYGADTTRAHLLFQAPVSEVLEWDEAKITGIQRWFARIWQLAQRLRQEAKAGYTAVAQDKLDAMREADLELWKATQSTIRSVTQSFRETFALNTVISDLMSLTNMIQESTGQESNATADAVPFDAFNIMLRLLIPIAPSFAEECWALVHGKEFLSADFNVSQTASMAGFPEEDGSLEKILARSQPCAVQVNGKLKFVVKIATAPQGISDEETREWILSRALRSPEGSAALQKGKWDLGAARKIIVARGGRTVNIVI